MNKTLRAICAAIVLAVCLTAAPLALWAAEATAPAEVPAAAEQPEAPAAGEASLPEGGETAPTPPQAPEQGEAGETGTVGEEPTDTPATPDPAGPTDPSAGETGQAGRPSDPSTGESGTPGEAPEASTGEATGPESATSQLTDPASATDEQATPAEASPEAAPLSADTTFGLYLEDGSLAMCDENGVALEPARELAWTDVTDLFVGSATPTDGLFWTSENDAIYAEALQRVVCLDSCATLDLNTLIANPFTGGGENLATVEISASTALDPWLSMRLNTNTSVNFTVAEGNPTAFSQGGALYVRMELRLDDSVMARSTGLDVVMLVSWSSAQGDLGPEDFSPEVSLIGPRALEYTDITSVTLPDRVLAVGTGAFGNCPQLCDVTLGANTAYLGFFDTSSLIGEYINASCVIRDSPNARFRLSSDDHDWWSIDENGALYTSEGEYLCWWQTATGDIVIPSGVQDIVEGALAGSSITSVTFRDHVSSLQALAFDNCPNLTDVYWSGEAPSSLEPQTFGYGQAIAHHVPGDLVEEYTQALLPQEWLDDPAVQPYVANQTVEAYNLFGCIMQDHPIGSGAGETPTVYLCDENGTPLDPLTEVSPASITTLFIEAPLGDRAFCSSETLFNLGNIDTIVLTDLCTGIGDDAFEQLDTIAPHLGTIVFQAGATNVSERSFRKAPLVDFVVDEGNTAFSSSNGALFSKDGSTLISWPNASGAIELPDGLTGIAADALEGRRGIVSVSFPASLEYLGTACLDAVAQNNLCWFTFRGTQPPELVGDPFGVGNSFIVSVDLAVVDTFKQAFYAASETAYVNVTFLGSGSSETIYGYLRQSKPGIIKSSEPVYVCDENGVPLEPLARVNPQSVSHLFIDSPLSSFAFISPYSGSSLSLPNVTSITLLSGCTSLGDRPFIDSRKLIPNLASLTIGEGTTMQDASFVGLEGVSIAIDEAHPAYCSIAGAVYNKDLTALVLANALPDTSSIPASVTEIRTAAFWRSTLSEIVVPEGIERVASVAFANCENLTRVVLPSTLISLAYDTESPSNFNEYEYQGSVFVGCPNLTFEVSPDNPVYTVVNGALVTKDGQNLIAWPQDSGVVYVPDGVVSISSYCFDNIGEVSQVILPASLRHIGQVAFSSATSTGVAELVFLGAEAPSIGSQAFGYGRSLNVYVPRGSLASYTAAFIEGKGENANMRIIECAIPDAGGNGVTGIAAGDTVTQGDTVTFTAVGAGMDNADPQAGDMRWLPSAWRINPSGDFYTGFTQSFDTTGMAPGTHELIVSYELQRYDGTDWVTLDGCGDTESVSITVNTASGGNEGGGEAPGTGGDTPQPPSTPASPDAGSNAQKIPHTGDGSATGAPALLVVIALPALIGGAAILRRRARKAA